MSSIVTGSLWSPQEQDEQRSGSGVDILSNCATFTDEHGAPRAGAQGRGPRGPRRVATRASDFRQGYDRQGQPGDRRAHGALREAQGAHTRVPPVLPPWETLFSALRAPRQRAPRPRRRRSRSSSKDERRCGRGRRRRRLRRRRRRVRRGPPLSRSSSPDS